MILFITHRTRSGPCWPLWPCLGPISLVYCASGTLVTFLFLEQSWLFLPSSLCYAPCLGQSFFRFLHGWLLLIIQKSVQWYLLSCYLHDFAFSKLNHYPFRIFGHSLNILFHLSEIRVIMLVCLLSLEYDLHEDEGLIFLAHWWVYST